MTFAVTHTFVGDTTAVASEANTNFTDVETELNDFPTDGALGSGVVDTTQLAADAVDGTKVADDAIDSEHYVDGSIDEAHLADDSVTDAKIKTSGAFSLFGTWTTLDSATNALVIDEVYKAGSDGLVCAYVADTITGLTDSSNPPTTTRLSDSRASPSNTSITMPVKKSDYWKITTGASTAATIYFLPIGTGSCVKQ